MQNRPELAIRGVEKKDEPNEIANAHLATEPVDVHHAKRGGIDTQGQRIDRGHRAHDVIEPVRRAPLALRRRQPTPRRIDRSRRPSPR